MSEIISCLQGTVIEKKDGVLKILLDSNQAMGCEGCKIKGACSLSSTLSNLKGQFYEITGNFDVKKGDYVKISVKESKTVFYSFMLFMFPLIAMITGGSIGFYVFPSNSEDSSIIGAFLGLIVALFADYLYSKIKKEAIKKSYIVEKIPSPYFRK